MKDLKVRVTRADIKAGEVDPCRCPIALAANRGFKQLGLKDTTAWVTPGKIIAIGPSEQEQRRWELPLKARQFVFDFDHDIKANLNPFSFTPEDMESTPSTLRFTQKPSEVNR